MKRKTTPQQTADNALDAALACDDSILVGIDWADKAHEYHLVTPDGQVKHGEFKQAPESIAHWIASLKQQHPDAQIEICIETSRGALINGLLEHDVKLFPINPNALAKYRESFNHGGGKSDFVDARLIFKFLVDRRQSLRPLTPNEPLTRRLAALAQDRRNLVQHPVELANQLTSTLKTYFPAALALDPAKVYADFMVRFLISFSTLQLAQSAGPTKLRNYFFGVGAKQKAQDRIETIMAANPLTTDEVVVSTCSRKVRSLCGLLKSINQSIGQYDREIKELVKQHADYAILASFPGSAAKTQARMIAALGDDRSRYDDCLSFQAASGIAPLTRQSGNQKVVTSRWACTKFVRQTFHEYAGLSINQSQWAKAFYKSQLAKGKKPQAAKRALAYKWMRIIFRCSKERVCYDEARYLQRLIDTNSPLAELLTASKA